MKAALLLAALALPGCAVVTVPVKVAGTAVGTTAKVAGGAVLAVTRADGDALQGTSPVAPH